MTTGLMILAIAVVAALAFGGYRALTDGRFRGSRATPVTQADPEPGPVEETAWAQVLSALPGARLGERATLVQFSSAFCAPCRATRRTLGDIAAVVPGVEHLEVDAEQHLELVRSLQILRTPTTVVLDAHGRESTRATGAPRKEQVLGALGGLT